MRYFLLHFARYRRLSVIVGLSLIYIFGFVCKFIFQIKTNGENGSEISQNRIDKIGDTLEVWTFFLFYYFSNILLLKIIKNLSRYLLDKS